MIQQPSKDPRIHLHQGSKVCFLSAESVVFCFMFVRWLLQLQISQFLPSQKDPSRIYIMSFQAELGHMASLGSRGDWGMECMVKGKKYSQLTQTNQTYWLLIVTCGIQFPDQASNPGPLHWECRVLTTGPPGKFLEHIYTKTFFFNHLTEIQT